ncbi:MAG: right-handed parallel beta-helix repeat-containing protein [bacterium]
MNGRSWIVALTQMGACLTILLTACGDDGVGDGNNSACAEGHRQQGAACVPIFDDCPGANEIPVLGGGCHEVGVTYCATGLLDPDGEGGCAPILPPDAGSCPAGTMGALGHTTCQPVGVTVCGDGFVSDGDGGCDAVLPPGPDPCPPGTIELLGYTTCQPLGDCGSGPWGNIVTDSTTVYVDQTYDGTAPSDGSAQAPFVTIGAALVAAPSNGQVAVAAGNYQESVRITDPVQLTGRCSELVTITGQLLLGAPQPALSVAYDAVGTALAGVTLTGPGYGLLIAGATLVTVENVEVVDTVSDGIVSLYESEVSYRRVKVAGAGGAGILASGSTVELTECVIRDTVPDSDGWFGRGINAECDPDIALCGSLSLTASVLSRNQEMGIQAQGVDVEITATVIRDTQPQGSDGTAGRGISAQCDGDYSLCGSLRVTDSLVVGNRDVGILAHGLPVTIVSTVVRDTLPQWLDDTYGAGISVQCDEDVDRCSTLSVTDSLVTGNRMFGINTGAAESTISKTAVRDTLPEVSSGTYGWGIKASCHLDPCGTLLIADSLVAANQDVGIALEGVDTTVVDSVIRDTVEHQAIKDESTDGRGINAQCNIALGRCGTLDILSSVISRNMSLGIFSAGVTTTVTSSVVRDTLPQTSTGEYGRGINAQDEPDLGVRGALEVRGCLITGNRDIGIFVGGTDATVTDTVVEETLSQQSDDTAGRGLNAQCNPASGECSRLTVARCLIAANRDVAITALGTPLTVTDSVVRDTLPDQSDGTAGHGISSQCDVFEPLCGSLRVTRSLVQNSQSSGIFIMGVPSVLEGVTVWGTTASQVGAWLGEYGQGVWARCDEDYEICADLQMSGCHVESSQSAGVALDGVSGFLHSSVVFQVDDQPLDDRYGYGVQVGGLESQQGAAMPSFHVTDCEIRDAKLAGVLYFRTRGTLARSVVSGAENSVVMNEGSEPTILDDNELSGTVEDDPTWANLFPSPAPPPSLPANPAR